MAAGTHAPCATLAGGKVGHEEVPLGSKPLSRDLNPGREPIMCPYGSFTINRYISLNIDI